MGATRTTNNTAEMQVLIEALYWLNSGIEDKSIPSCKKVMVTVESLDVKGLIDQKCMARDNKEIALLPCHLWKVVRNKVSINIRWVRGHSGDAGNGVADELADLGTRLDEKHRWWKRIQPMGDWEESSSQTKLKKVGGRKIQNAKALWDQWDCEVNFPPSDLPMLKTMAEVVSQSATKWGAASCKCSHEDDNRKNDIRRLHAERKREKKTQ